MLILGATESKELEKRLLATIEELRRALLSIHESEANTEQRLEELTSRIRAGRCPESGGNTGEDTLAREQSIATGQQASRGGGPKWGVPTESTLVLKLDASPKNSLKRHEIIQIVAAIAGHKMKSSISPSSLES